MPPDTGQKKPRAFARGFVTWRYDQDLAPIALVQKRKFTPSLPV
jgi:hypothetical protein